VGTSDNDKQIPARGRRRGKIRIKSEETINCPICGNSLYVIGTRNRMIIGSGGTPMTIIIRRLRCKQCGKIHHELPDIVVPYKRHSAEAIEKIISGEAGEVIIEESTLRRIRNWWSSWRLYFASILASLEAKYGVAFEKSAPREIVRAIVNSNFWIHTRSAFSPG
jgi:transcription elongation factor Elf1